MSKLTISDLHFCDIDLDASDLVGGGSGYQRDSVDLDHQNDTQVDLAVDKGGYSYSQGFARGNAQNFNTSSPAKAYADADAYAR